MNSRVKIRAVRKNDIKQILGIAEQVYQMVQKQRSNQFGKLMEFSHSADFYLNAIGSKESVIFVAEMAKGELVGYVYAAIETQPDDLISIPYLSINEIAVKRAYQGMGIGKSLLQRAERWAKEKGITVIQLATWEFNQPALSFFKNLGYRTIMRKMEKVLSNEM